MFIAWLKFMGLVVLAFLVSLALVALIVYCMKAKERREEELRRRQQDEDSERRRHEKDKEYERRKQREKEQKIADLDSTWKGELEKLGTRTKQRELYFQISNRRTWQVPEEEKLIKAAQERIQESKELLQRLSHTDRNPELRAIKKAQKEVLKALGQEFDMIAALPDVEEIYTRDGWFVTLTKELELPHNSESRYLGRFKIAIHSDHEIRLIPLDGKKDAVVHPSVKGDTILMKPSLRLSITRLLAKHKVSDVVAILLDFLKTYDPKLAFVKL